ncbi:MAG: efflux RND transporter periplasmic adaptor subunit [Chloroflexota bacterium]|nr:efflux RND transporter periplasmic adaptor subunit [Lentimicrobium sp.]
MKKLFYTVIVLAISVASCKQADKKNTSTASEEKTEVVKVIPLAEQRIAHTVEYQATLEPFEEIHLAPASPGRIDLITVEVGDHIKKGQLLVQMDKTQLQSAELQLKNLATDFKRLDTLRKVGSIAPQKYDQLKTQYEVQQATVDFLRENTRLAAPFNGVVSGKYFEAGEMYSSVPNTAAGKAAILSLVQVDRLKAVVNVTENFYPVIKQGMKVDVKTDVYPDKTFAGRITLVHPTINAVSRTFQVEVTIDNNGGILKPGMFSRVTLTPGETDALLLPALAVLKMQGSNERYLFVEKNGIAKRISVTMGQRYNDNVEVLSQDLKAGDNVIISGQARLLDGMKVTVVKN